MSDSEKSDSISGDEEVQMMKKRNEHAKKNRKLDDGEEENMLDDEEEDDNEDYDSEEYDEKPKKENKKTVSGFIFDEAEVDEDEDEDDAGDAESDFEELRQEMNLAARDEGPSARDIEGQRRLGMLYNGDEDRVVEYFRKKYEEMRSYKNL